MGRLILKTGTKHGPKRTRSKVLADLPPSFRHNISVFQGPAARNLAQGGATARENKGAGATHPVNGIFVQRSLVILIGCSRKR